MEGFYDKGNEVQNMMSTHGTTQERGEDDESEEEEYESANEGDTDGEAAANEAAAAALTVTVATAATRFPRTDPSSPLESCAFATPSPPQASPNQSKMDDQTCSTDFKAEAELTACVNNEAALGGTLSGDLVEGHTAEEVESKEAEEEEEVAVPSLPTSSSPSSCDERAREKQAEIVTKNREGTPDETAAGFASADVASLPVTGGLSAPSEEEELLAAGVGGGCPDLHIDELNYSSSGAEKTEDPIPLLPLSASVADAGSDCDTNGSRLLEGSSLTANRLPNASFVGNTRGAGTSLHRWSGKSNMGGTGAGGGGASSSKTEDDSTMPHSSPDEEREDEEDEALYRDAENGYSEEDGVTKESEGIGQEKREETSMEKKEATQQNLQCEQEHNIDRQVAPESCLSPDQVDIHSSELIEDDYERYVMVMAADGGEDEEEEGVEGGMEDGDATDEEEDVEDNEVENDDEKEDQSTDDDDDYDEQEDFACLEEEESLLQKQQQERENGQTGIALTAGTEMRRTGGETSQHPTFTPRVGKFFMHDLRSNDEPHNHQASPMDKVSVPGRGQREWQPSSGSSSLNAQQQPLSQFSSVACDSSDKWQHDMFRPTQSSANPLQTAPPDSPPDTPHQPSLESQQTQNSPKSPAKKLAGTTNSTGAKGASSSASTGNNLATGKPTPGVSPTVQSNQQPQQQQQRRRVPVQSRTTRSKAWSGGGGGAGVGGCNENLYPQTYEPRLEANCKRRSTRTISNSKYNSSNRIPKNVSTTEDEFMNGAPQHVYESRGGGNNSSRASAPWLRRPAPVGGGNYHHQQGMPRAAGGGMSQWGYSNMGNVSGTSNRVGGSSLYSRGDNAKHAMYQNNNNGSGSGTGDVSSGGGGGGGRSYNLRAKQHQLYKESDDSGYNVDEMDFGSSNMYSSNYSGRGGASYHMPGECFDDGSRHGAFLSARRQYFRPPHPSSLVQQPNTPGDKFDLPVGADPKSSHKYPTHFGSTRKTTYGSASFEERGAAKNSSTVSPSGSKSLDVGTPIGEGHGTQLQSKPSASSYPKRKGAHQSRERIGDTSSKTSGDRHHSGLLTSTERNKGLRSDAGELSSRRVVKTRNDFASRNKLSSLGGVPVEVAQRKDSRKGTVGGLGSVDGMSDSSDVDHLQPREKGASQPFSAVGPGGAGGRRMKTSATGVSGTTGTGDSRAEQYWEASSQSLAKMTSTGAGTQVASVGTTGGKDGIGSAIQLTTSADGVSLASKKIGVTRPFILSYGVDMSSKDANLDSDHQVGYIASEEQEVSDSAVNSSFGSSSTNVNNDNNNKAPATVAVAPYPSSSGAGVGMSLSGNMSRTSSSNNNSNNRTHKRYSVARRISPSGVEQNSTAPPLTMNNSNASYIASGIVPPYVYRGNDIAKAPCGPNAAAGIAHRHLAVGRDGDGTGFPYPETNASYFGQHSQPPSAFMTNPHLEAVAATDPNATSTGAIVTGLEGGGGGMNPYAMQTMLSSIQQMEQQATCPMQPAPPPSHPITNLHSSSSRLLSNYAPSSAPSYSVNSAQHNMTNSGRVPHGSAAPQLAMMAAPDHSATFAMGPPPPPHSLNLPQAYANYYNANMSNPVSAIMGSVNGVGGGGGGDASTLAVGGGGGTSAAGMHPNTAAAMGQHPSSLQEAAAAAAAAMYYYGPAAMAMAAAAQQYLSSSSTTANSNTVAPTTSANAYNPMSKSNPGAGYVPAGYQHHPHHQLMTGSQNQLHNSQAPPHPMASQMGGGGQQHLFSAQSVGGRQVIAVASGGGGGVAGPNHQHSLHSQPLPPPHLGIQHHQQMNTSNLYQQTNSVNTQQETQANSGSFGTSARREHGEGATDGRGGGGVRGDLDGSGVQQPESTGPSSSHFYQE